MVNSLFLWERAAVRGEATMADLKSEIANFKSLTAAARVIASQKAQGWPSLGLRRRAVPSTVLCPLPSSPLRPLPSLPRSGFTLVELLVTIAVIAVLATLLLGALYTAQDAARAQKTRSTIAKLHTMMMSRWESYKTRRVPITIPPGTQPKIAARMRLDALRELMRLEMPDRYSDIIDNPAIIARPSVSHAYLRKVTSAPAGYANDHDRAECFYMIITLGADDDDTAADKFGASEVGDADGDGLREFHDAWGTPIRFLRWAPGFVSELQTRDPSTQPDPFDPRHVYPTQPTDPAPAQTEITFALYPLIYSAGPDKEFDIYGGEASFQYSGAKNNPYVGLIAPNVFPLGQIGATVDIPVNGEQNWQDNIHNHLIGSR